MTPRNCITRQITGAPDDTTCITIQAQEVREGDYLDMGTFIARVFNMPEHRRDAVTLHIEGHRPQVRKCAQKVKVWRDSGEVGTRPIDLRTDRPVQNLTHAMTLGRAGLNNIFKIGSLWEVGPFVEGVNPKVVRVIAKNSDGAAHTSGTNYSSAPEDAAALGKPKWFINCEALYMPYVDADLRESGHPPIVLCALTPRMAAVAGVACCATYIPPCSCNIGVIWSMRTDAERFRATITKQNNTIRGLERKLASAQLRANSAERKIASIERALR